MLSYRQQDFIRILVFVVSTAIPIAFFVGDFPSWIAGMSFSLCALVNHWAERNLSPLSFKSHGAALIARNVLWFGLAGIMTMQIFHLQWTNMSPIEALVLGICAFAFIANSVIGFGFDTIQFIPKAVSVYLIKRARMGFKATWDLHSRIENEWDSKPIPTAIIGIAGIVLSIWFM